MNFHVLTLFPQMIEQGLSESIMGRAIKNGLVSLDTINIRDFSDNKHKKVDDYTYGGGAGMLMQAEPVYCAIKSVTDKIEAAKKSCRVIYVTPQGSVFDQQMAEEFAKCDELVFLCGHYEGIDERVLEETVTDYVSIGDYVLTGGEMPAMVMIDAVSRLVPGVLHNDISAETESFHGSLLEYPQYSRPIEWHGKRVPDILMSGNQKEIEKWRKNKSVERTRQRRPDLYKEYVRLEECKQQLGRNKLQNIDMIELINRGKARLLYSSCSMQLLMDIVSKNCYFSYTDSEKVTESELSVVADILNGIESKTLIVHQKDSIKIFEEAGYSYMAECKLAVYTQKEKLSARGLYRLDGKINERGLYIRQLKAEDYIAVHCLNSDRQSMPYIEGRAKAGALYGAFISKEGSEDNLIGTIGFHADGSVGMLSVKEENRRSGVASALETFILNTALEKGQTPYCYVPEENTEAVMLEKKLGLYFSKQSVIWMKR